MEGTLAVVKQEKCIRKRWHIDNTDVDGYPQTFLCMYSSIREIPFHLCKSVCYFIFRCMMQDASQ